MEAKKGVQSRYATLLARDVLPVQTAHLKTSFELAPASKLAEAACRVTNQVIEAWEKEQGTRRLKPGELLLEQEDQKVAIPLLAQEVLPALKGGPLPGRCAGNWKCFSSQGSRKSTPGPAWKISGISLTRPSLP